MKPLRYGICIDNRDYPASLEVRKVYEFVDDPKAREQGMVRVTDESGEDYLYPADLFVPIRVPREATRAFTRRSA